MNLKYIFGRCRFRIRICNGLSHRSLRNKLRFHADYDPIQYMVMVLFKKRMENKSIRNTISNNLDIMMVLISKFKFHQEVNYVAN